MRKWRMQNGEWRINNFLNSQLSTFNSSGQTLVEAIVAIAIAVVIVTALVTLGIGTQRAANTSRIQNQNTRYGEETIELVRSIRDANLEGAFNLLTLFPCNPNCKFSDLFSPTTFFGTTGTYFSLPAAISSGGCVGLVDCWELTVEGNSNPKAITGTIYSRTIRISDSGNTTDPVDPADKVKHVEVVIRWSDAAGDHDSKTTTKLINLR